MGIENNLKKKIAKALADSCDLSEERALEVVDESVDIDVHRPLGNVTGTHSVKPTNATIGFQLPKLFEVASGVGVLSDDVWGQAAAAAGLFSIILRQTYIEIDRETAFVYWVAYENRHEMWEIPRNDLVDSVLNSVDQVDEPLDVDEDSVDYYIRRLEEIRAIETQDDGDTIILRETCSAEWDLA